MTDISNQASLDEIRQSYESRFAGVPSEMKDCINAHYKPKNEKAEFAVQVLRKYAHQTGNTLRGTSDLSPLEEWLIIQLMLAQKEDNKACSNIGKNIISPIDKI